MNRPGRAVATIAIALAAASVPADEPWQAGTLVRAAYAAPTTRYPHGVLGDEVEYGALVLHYAQTPSPYTIRLPDSRVFEDIAPRRVDVDGDGRDEAMVVESHRDLGARLALYDGGGLIAATPYIGTRNRWLAPVGAADLDGDGHIEIAYIDRPHLAKTLRIWRFRDGRLTEIASLSGLTNHRIGWDHIPGGIRDCGHGPEIITADGTWHRIVASTLIGGSIETRTLGPYTGPDSINARLTC